MNKHSRSLMKADFALLETVLYLDTHPNDTKALEYYEKARKAYHDARDEYEAMHGPTSADSDFAVKNGNFAWSTNPWPWQNDEA